MKTPKNILSPTLAIDLGVRTTSAILYDPAVNWNEQARFTMPSKELGLLESLAGHKKNMRHVYLTGEFISLAVVDVLAQYCTSGLSVAMHPATAAVLCDDPKALESFGVKLVELPPPNHATLKFNDYDPAFWAMVQSVAGLPGFESVLLAVHAYDHPFSSLGKEERKLFWKTRFTSAKQKGVPPEALFDGHGPLTMRQKSLSEKTGGLVVDSTCAVIMGALQLPDILNRTFKQGIVLAWAGHPHTLAALLYNGRIFGIYEIPSRAFVLEEWLKDIESFRLGWLPIEKAESQGGFAYMADNLPPEAEGFSPMYAAGPCSGMLESQARMINCGFGNPYIGCIGLLAGHDQNQLAKTPE